MSDVAARAVARLQEMALRAAQSLNSGFVVLVCTRDSIPRGERFRLIANIKSPLGELLNVKPNGARFDCAGRFPAMDILAFCMAKLDELGAPCPVEVRAPPSQEE